MLNKRVSNYYFIKSLKNSGFSVKRSVHVGRSNANGWTETHILKFD